MDGVLVGFALVLAGAAGLWVAWIGSQRRLPPNSWIGVRLPQTRRSDAAWYAAHEASAGPLGLGGGVAAFCGLGVLVTGLDTVGLAVAAIGVVGLLAGTSVATVAAVRAAGAVPDPSEGPDLSG